MFDFKEITGARNIYWRESHGIVVVNQKFTLKLKC